MMTNDKLSDDIQQAVMDCQRRFWSALQQKEAELFLQILAEDFVCRSPGQEDQDRTTFIATLTSIPFPVVGIRGEDIAICVVGDVAILTGTQVAQMRLPNGAIVPQRLALTNVFQKIAGMWKMILAHPVLLTQDV
jgi:ketosteroid isomerase-like protein